MPVLIEYRGQMKLRNKHIINRLHCYLTVLLTIMCCAFASAQVVADFTAVQTSGCAPILVQFNDISAGKPTQWKWDLGNGTVSYLQNPSVTYFSPGKYSVKLVIQSSANTDSVVKEKYITVYAPPVVDFAAATATTGCTPMLVTLNDKSKPVNGSLVKWEWDLGDGKFLYNKDAAYTYLTAGDYNVTLKVTDSYGCAASARKAGYVKANGVNADFVTTDVYSCTETKVLFENKTTGNGNIFYELNWGDGSVATLKDTAHIYAKRGQYTVKLSAKNNLGCSDTISKLLKLPLLVNAGFTADKQFDCAAPAVINFNSDYLFGSSYLWDFGDSTTSETANPVHVYSDTGTYNVKLIVANAKGCIDSVKKKEFIHIGKLNLALLNLPDSNCVGYNKKFTVTSDVQDSLVSYLWNFGDGQTSTEASPDHLFNDTGYYNVSLIAEGASGCKDTVIMQNAIRIDTKPTANFSADILKACAKQAITFTDLSTGGANNWEWHFGDDNIGNGQNPQNLYKDTGYMNVMLIAKRGGCGDTVTFNNYIYINPPVAKYKPVYKCDDPLSVSFINNSIGDDAEWDWSFGDGTFSTDENPVHVYADTGTYNVTLVVKNAVSGCTHSLTRELPLYSIQTSFSVSDTAACNGDVLLFQAPADSNNIGRYVWNFGDGSRVSGVSDKVEHVYDKAGLYSVMLVAINAKNGCRDTVIKTNYIHINGPHAQFKPNVASVTANNSITFLDSSYSDGISPIKTWQWNYGDDKTEILTTAPFRHVYEKTGLFYPLLTVTDSSGCSNSYQYPVPVVVKGERLNFEVAKNILCPGSEIKFYAEPFNTSYTYTWNFGDGTVMNGINPKHVFEKEGVFDVKMVITFKDGKRDSLTRTNFIRIVAPVINYNITDSFKYCPPLNVTFTDLSSKTIKAVWDFGDGTSTENKNPSHFYSLPGVYPTRLIVTGEGGCTKEMQKNIVIKGPSGTIEYDSATLCHSYTASLVTKSQNAVSYTWDFNDGNTISNTDTFITHTYIDPGNYRPKIILVDGNGCKVPIAGSKEIRIIKADAAFAVKANTICDSSTAYFSNTSLIQNDQLLSYQWDFGDGNISNETSPVHDYAADGKYIPQLILKTAQGCVDTFIADLPITIALPPKVDFSLSPNGCTPLTVQVSTQLNQPGASGIKWNWDFKNGNTANEQNPAQQLYADAGVYNVQLAATSSNGCIKKIIKNVEAYKTPIVRTGNDTAICKGVAVNLSANGADTYNWNVASQNTASLLLKPDSTSRYIVKGTNNNGCSAFDTVTITINQPVVLKYKTSERICKGGSVKLQAEGASSYSWYPAKGLSSTIVASPIAQPDTTAQYRVIGYDNSGCFNDTGYVTVNITPLPYVDAGEDKAIASGTSIDLVPKMSDDVVEANWYPTSGIFRNSDFGITVKPEQTTEYTLEAKNAGGCRAKDKVQVTVLCNGSNVFIPNTFSPNGDGSNEVFYIQGKGTFKIKSFRIFSRWGQEVFYKADFNANDPSSGWDGTFKGAKEQSDAYVYLVEVVCTNNTVFTLKGNVALVR